MSARGKCKYSEAFEKTFPCIKKSRTNDVYKAYCIECRKDFSIQNKGKFDIEQHIKSKAHMNLVSTSEKQKLDNYFTRKNSSEEFDLIRDELLWSYHSVRHNHSFRSMDCTSNLLKLFCNKKFSCARTKTEALVKNVIGEWCNEHLKKN